MAYEYLDLLKKSLDDRQKKVCCRKGNTVVAAGAGSGKTQVLATRFAWLVMSCNIPASKILTLTFTKKAAGEMYDRIYQTLAFFAEHPQTPLLEKERARRALEVFGESHIQTLDSYCSNIVRQAANRYGIRPDFTTGSADSEREIKDAALPFVLKYRDNFAIQAFADPGRLQEFAEKIIAASVNKYASIADSDTFFTEKLPLQCKKIAKDFNYFIFGHGSAPEEMDSTSNLKELSNEIYYALDECNLDNSFTQKVRKLTGIIDSIYNQFEIITDEQVSGNCNEELLSLCDNLSQASNINLKEKGVVKSITPLVKKIRDEIVPMIDAFTNYIRQFKTIKELFTLLDLFHARIKRSKKVSGNLSFRDIQKMALIILQNEEDLRMQEYAAYDKIMIDEFQDNNGENRELLFLLSSSAQAGPHPNVQDISSEKLFFVGDEKQSIYKFRGADVSVFNALQNDFKNQFGPESVLPMEYNYRSNNSLIVSFNKLFGGEKGIFDKNQKAEYEAQYSTETKKYNPIKKEVVSPEVLNAENVKMHFCILNRDIFKDYQSDENGIPLDLPDEKEQTAYFIAKKIYELCSKGIPYNKIAVLDKSRTNRGLLIKWLNIFGIPYSLDQNASLFDSGLVYDFYNFLRLCVYPSDLNAYAAYLSSPFAALPWNALEIILALNSEENKNEKIKELLSSESFELYLKAEAFVKENSSLVLSQPLTKTLELLWNKSGYRYECMLNRRTQLAAEQFDLLYEMARSCDEDGKSPAWFVDQLALIHDGEKSSFADDSDLDSKEIVYPIEKEDAVQILTIHKSKGLQYDHVFVCGCFDSRSRSDSSAVFYDEKYGLTVKPEKSVGNYFYILQNNLASRKTLAEFRRLIYVAITRAVEEVYIVGTVSPSSASSKGEPTKISMKLLEEQLEKYYSNWANPEYAFEKTEYKAEAPFDYFSIKPVLRNVVNELKYKNKELAPEEIRKLFLEKALPLYKESNLINLEEEAVSRATPSSMESAENAEEIEISTKDQYEKITSIIAKNCSLEGPDDFDSAQKSEADGILMSSIFAFSDFGSLAHAYEEAFVNGSPANLFQPDLKVFKNLKDEEIDFVKAACSNMVKTFSESPLGAKLKAAKENGRFVKAEYTFRTQIDGMLITGSIDLIFENEDGTYTIVDYKTDRRVRPQMYYSQQNCYRIAASRLLNCSESSIKCYLYYLRYDYTIDISENL
ncbi:MAG: UvrD-helicase domain-containing protein [Treponema sp.]|nr:UvrD-helicase domain-containing protein [Treponema sp.]